MGPQLPGSADMWIRGYVCGSAGPWFRGSVGQFVRGSVVPWYPIVADWIDTGVATEKQAVVLLLHPPEQPPLVVVALRGSKALQVRTQSCTLWM